jgi:hypothetical protein
MKLTMRNTIVTPTLTKLTASTDTAIEFDDRDDKMVLVIKAESATTLKVKKGNGIQGAADLTLDIPVGVSLLKLDSGCFMNISGEYKDKIVVNSPGTPSVGIAALV